MSKDLFDESTMTFGEHLEALRVHLFQAIVGLLIGMIVSLFFSHHVIRIVQQPVTEAALRLNATPTDAKQFQEGKSFFSYLSDWLSGKPAQAGPATSPGQTEGTTSGSAGTAGTSSSASTTVGSRPGSGAEPSSIRPAKPVTEVAVPGSASGVHGLADGATVAVLTMNAVDIARVLHQVDSKTYPAIADDAKPIYVRIPVSKESADQIVQDAVMAMRRENAVPRTDTPDEAFMMYLKVSMVMGVIISSPWIFYQIWMFVAAGLYPHEKSYVYRYLPMAIGLFLAGSLFCFFAVIPIMLDFLFGFNAWLGLRPEIKIASWINFAMVVSLMFGISFELPLVMLLIERLSLVAVNDYRTHRKMAILVISIISMVLTPSDPVSMMMMMIPLLILYEFGILLCGKGTQSSPFGDAPTS